MLQIAATVAASVAALLAICVSIAIWVRTTPVRVLAELRDAQECAARAEHASKKAVEDVASVRAAWLTQQQDIEKYLDSIDSRARRLSAVKSQETRAERREERNGPEDDAEAVMAALRTEAGM